MPAIANNPAAERIRYATPRASVRETADAYLLQAEMPGVNKEGVEVTLEDHTLLIVGRRASAPREETVVHSESKGADYRRTFEMNAPIDASKISAKIDQGLLTVTLPKAEEAIPRQIPIQG